MDYDFFKEFINSVEKHQDKVALKYQEETITYKELLKQVLDFATLIKEWGISQNESFLYTLNRSNT